MNRVAVLVFISIALVGCAKKNTLTDFDCTIDLYRGPCVISGTPATPTLGIRKTANGLVVTPKALCTQPSADVTVTITPPDTSPPGTVIIAAKNLQNAVWLLGANNDDPNEIEVSIPENVKEGEYHYVVIDSVTGDCLDPRWDVEYP